MCWASANDLDHISKEARKGESLAQFLDRLNEGRTNYFRDRIASRCASETEAFGLLKRLHVETVSQDRLIEQVEERTRLCLYDGDGDLDPHEARLYIADFILDRLGQSITRENLVAKLNEGGFFEANWAQDQRIRHLIGERNESYLRSVKLALINNELIRRQESDTALNQILTGSGKYGLFIGTAGVGKSCSIAGLLEGLGANGIPYFALRLDTPYGAMTPMTLGRELGFPMSPVNLLAAVAEGGRSVLLLDQLDALSFISGRKTITWELLSDLLAEAEAYPNMRVWLACRDFDLQYDYRLQRLVAERAAQQVSIGLLSVDVVQYQINQRAGLSADALTPAQIEMLRTPMHLSLYLEGEPENQPSFASVQDLYNRYWRRKKEKVDQRLGRESKWNGVMDHLCDELSHNQTLTAPRLALEENFGTDVQAMASEHVIVLDLGRYRFFHEGFFDYAFARRFALRNRTLVELLLHDGEQHLFRRAQVRQILSYLRDQDDGRDRYYKELRLLMTTDGIRPHIIKLVMDWLANQPDPSLEEADILKLV